MGKDDPLRVQCWCGARPGLPCVNRQGHTVEPHHTRGLLDRKTVNAIAQSSGLPTIRTRRKEHA